MVKTPFFSSSTQNHPYQSHKRAQTTCDSYVTPERVKREYDVKAARGTETSTPEK
jgi:hypothetical protein